MKTLIIAGIALLGGLIVTLNSFTTIDKGHVGVVSLFGDVNEEELGAGFHWVNPLSKVEEVNIQHSEYTFEGVDVPSQDKLLTDVDVSVKWRVNPVLAAESLRDTGNKDSLVTTHIIPKARSVIRETGKTVAKADDFFKDEVQGQMQAAIYNGLKDSLALKGIEIEEVLIRGVRLPRSVAEGVIATKQREIEGQKQIAELERFRTEQQQKIAQAEAELEAAKKEAERKEVEADARAYQITAEAKARAEAIRIEGQAITQNPNLIKLRQVEQWDGVMPKFFTGNSGSTGVLFSMSDLDNKK